MHLLDELVFYTHLLHNQGFVAATDGNVSVRTGTNSVLITRSGVPKREVKYTDFIEVDFSGRVLKGSGKISTEHKLHFHIYRNRPEIKSVFHSHPVNITAACSSRLNLDRPFFPEIILSIGRSPLCRYANPSTDDLHLSLDPFINFANVFLLENHGLVTTGGSVKEAYYRTEKMEHYAKTVVAAVPAGGLNEIPGEKLSELYNIADSTYGIKLHPKNRYL
ncbi:MAG: class II aldolase/adducin family protein [Ignavibacteriaceae bacterium]|nr:class II aldolase/adducin family protein [Ignavibacteriaceae bacterium]